MDNNIRSLYEDHDGYLWAGLSSGIAKIKINLPIKFYGKNISQILSITRDVIQTEDKFIIGTDIGLKYSSVDPISLSEVFSPIDEGPKTQVWDLLQNNDVIYVGSNKGLGIINKAQLYSQLIDKNKTGSVYKILESKIFNNHLLIGTKKGLFSFNTETLELNLLSKKAKGAVWKVVEDKKNNQLWFVIYGEGLYKLNLSDNELININDVLSKDFELPDSSISKVYMSEINDEFFVFFKGFAFVFDDKQKVFTKETVFKDIINHPLDYIDVVSQINENKTWIVKNSRAAGKRRLIFYELSKQNELIRLPFDEISAWDSIKIVPIKDAVAITGTNGIVISPIEIPELSSNGQSIITRIEITNDPIYSGALTHDFASEYKHQDEFSYFQNKVRFKVAITDYYKSNLNKFRYKLENFDEWSEFTNNNELTYTNLSPGDYELKVESINGRTEELKSASYKFIINPPWWETNIFYISEVCFFILLFLLIIFTKKSSRGSKIATSLIFLVILIIFEIVNTKLDPVVNALSGGVPVFALASKVVLALLLEPLVSFSTTMIDKLTGYEDKQE